jgi:hypothetical protein
MGRYVVRQGRRIEVETLEIAAPPTRRKRVRIEETFARIPHKRGIALHGRISASAWIVLLELDRLIFESYGCNPVRLTNQALEAVGMSRSTKLKALRQLEEVGVVTVVQDGHEASIVTHLWHPLKP